MLWSILDGECLLKGNQQATSDNPPDGVFEDDEHLTPCLPVCPNLGNEMQIQKFGNGSRHPQVQKHANCARRNEDNSLTGLHRCKRVSSKPYDRLLWYTVSLGEVDISMDLVCRERQVLKDGKERWFVMKAFSHKVNNSQV